MISLNSAFDLITRVCRGANISISSLTSTKCRKKRATGKKTARDRKRKTGKTSRKTGRKQH